MGVRNIQKIKKTIGDVRIFQKTVIGKWKPRMAKSRSKPRIHDARYPAVLVDKTGVSEIFKTRGYNLIGGSGQRRGV